MKPGKFSKTCKASLLKNLKEYPAQSINRLVQLIALNTMSSNIHSLHVVENIGHQF